MAERIVHESGLFLPILGDEDRFEHYIAGLSSQLFPDYYWCDFKAEIQHPNGLVHADAALVAKDYSRWYVVEVELSQHRWHEHVRPQLTKLSNGLFCDRHRQILRAKQPLLNDEGLSRLDIYHPDIILIIEMASPTIRNWCRSNNIICIEAFPYRSRSNDILLAINGDQPSNLGEPDRRLVGRATLVDYSTEVPILLYDLASEVSEQKDSFQLLIGEKTIIAKNFGSKLRGVALQCSRQEFEELLGSGREFEFVRTSMIRTYRLEARVASKL